MKRILFVNASLQIGGVERSLCDIIQHLDQDKYKVYLYLDSCGNGFFPEIADKVTLVTPNMENCFGPLGSIAVHLIKERKFRTLALRMSRSVTGLPRDVLLSILQRIYLSKYGPFDCVISFREGSYATIARRYFLAEKYICWWHGSNPPHSDDLPNYKNTKDFSTIVAVSNSTKKMIHETIPAVNNIVVVPNMINSNNICRCSGTFPYTDDSLHIVSVGRLAPEKHFENLIPAAKALRERGVAFSWHIIGEGTERTKLEALIAENALGSQVILEGSKTNPYPYMKHADLFVHPSYVESQGLTVLEAMALGVPCVVTKSRGPCEFIENGINGILTEQSPESLTEKVLEMINDTALYRRIKENTKCPEQFRPERVMEQIEALIDA